MIATISSNSSQYEETINTLKYANRAKNIKMRVEPNKKLVSQHISAYKNIIADLRDEIDKLKSQLQHDIANKTNPLVTKHNQMYKPPSTKPQPLDQMGNPVVRNIKELDSVRSSDLDDNKDISALVSGRTNVCQECDLRTRDEPHK